MTRYHVSADGYPRVCKAQSAESCTANGLGNESPIHGDFADQAEAMKFAEKVNEEFHSDAAVRGRLKPGTEILDNDGQDTDLMRRYGTSFTATVGELSKDGRSISVDVDLYDGTDAEPDVIINDTIENLNKAGLVGEDKKVEFTFKAKYDQHEIAAYDPEDENSNEEDGGEYGLEVGHDAVYASVPLVWYED